MSRKNVKNIKFVALRSFKLIKSKRIKLVFGQGSAPDPAEGAYGAPQTLVGRRGGTGGGSSLPPTKLLGEQVIGAYILLPIFFCNFFLIRSW